MREPAKRSFRRAVPTFASTGYVIALSLRNSDARMLPHVLWLVAALGAAIFAARAKRTTLWLGLWGTALATASFPGGSALTSALGQMGAGLAMVAAHLALRTVDIPKALAPPMRRRLHLDLPLQVFLWGFSVVVSLAAWRGRAFPGLTPEATEALVSAQSIAVLLLFAGRLLRLRRLELVAVARLMAILAWAATVALFGATLVTLAIASPELASRVAIPALCLGTVFLAKHADPYRVALLTRRIIVLGFYAGGVILLFAVASSLRPAWAPFLGAVSAFLTVLLGAHCDKLESSLRPYGGVWLDALEQARLALRGDDEDACIRGALFLLREVGGPLSASPALFTLRSGLVLTVDAAGYTRERKQELHPLLLEVAREEPYATLRSEVLDSLVVRRADLRTLGVWFDDHGAFCATVLTHEGHAEGLLLLPRGDRGVPLSLEEATAIAELGEALVRPLLARGRSQVALEREQELTYRCERLEDKVSEAEQQLFVRRRRDERIARRLITTSCRTAYGPASRLLVQALERRALRSEGTAMVVPRGTSASGWVAQAHASSPRRTEPLVIVEGASSEGQRKSDWADRNSSPLALAEGGTLLIADVGALGAEVQSLLAQCMSEHRLPWESGGAPNFWLVVTTRRTPVSLLEEGSLEPSLASWLEGALSSPVVVPSLADRPEDLHALVSERIAREGLRARGVPMGISEDALSYLLERQMPANDLELEVLASRIVGDLEGPLVSRADLETLKPERFLGRP